MLVHLMPKFDNYFHFSNLTFENLTDNLVLEEKVNSIFDKYLAKYICICSAV